MDSYFKTDFFSTFFNQKDNPLLKQFENTDDILNFEEYFGNELDYRLLLPGKILQANNADLLHDTLVWKITAYRMVLSDYEICAQSRKANPWAFILPGIIILGAVSVFFFKIK